MDLTHRTREIEVRILVMDQHGLESLGWNSSGMSLNHRVITTLSRMYCQDLCKGASHTRACCRCDFMSCLTTRLPIAASTKLDSFVPWADQPKAIASGAVRREVLGYHTQSVLAPPGTFSLHLDAHGRRGPPLADGMDELVDKNLCRGEGDVVFLVDDNKLTVNKFVM